MQRPEGPLFDLGGVLVENVGFERFNALLPTPLPTGDLKTRWLASPAVRCFEKGACSSDSFATALLEEWQIGLTPQEFIVAFASWPEGLYPGATKLLSLLRGRYRLACLSNSNAIHWERSAGLREQFDIRLSSHLLGEVKPDPQCYERALQECGVGPFRLAFFDDSLANVSAARELGISAFHVNGLHELRGALVAQGWFRRRARDRRCRQREFFALIQQADPRHITLLAVLGVQGDAHCGVTVKHRSRVARDPTQPNLRQVHLLHVELLADLRGSGFDVGPSDLGENITTRRIDLLRLPRGGEASNRRHGGGRSHRPA